MPRRHAEHLTLHRTGVRVDIDLHSFSHLVIGILADHQKTLSEMRRPKDEDERAGALCDLDDY